MVIRQLKKTIGAILFIAGLTVAIVTPDDCKNELKLRFGGMAAFAIGAFLAEAYDGQNKQKTKRLQDASGEDNGQPQGIGAPLGAQTP